MKKLIANIYEAGELAEQIDSAGPADLHRIANALERIATSLEKLTGNDSMQPIVGVIAPATRELAEPAQDAGKALPTTYDAPPAKQAATTPVKEVIGKFLTRRGVVDWEEKTKPYSPERQQKLDELALFLGENFNECKVFYQWLKKQLSQPGAIIIYLFNGADSKHSKTISELCRMLQTAELIDSLTALDLPGPGIQFKLATNGINFLTGHWLERFVRLKLDRVAKKSVEKGYDAKSNIIMTFQNDQRAELDLIFSVGSQVFCVESKTYPGSKDLKEYLKRIEPLRMHTQNLLIVTAEKSPEQCLTLTKTLGGVQVIGLDKLEETLTSILNTAS